MAPQKGLIGVFSKLNGNSVNSGKFKDPVSHMCFAGAVVASKSLTQEVAGLNPFTVMTNSFVTEFSKFSENI